MCFVDHNALLYMNTLLRLLAFWAITSALASCGRATYPMSAKAPLYLGSAHLAPQQQMPAATASIVHISHPASAAAPAQAGRAGDFATVTQPSGALPAAASLSNTAKTKALAPPRPGQPSLVQKILLKRMATQLHKVQVARRNVAQIARGQSLSRAGRAAIIALVGAVLIAIVIGSSANSIENATGLILLGIIGYALLVTGIVLLVISLVNGS